MNFTPSEWMPIGMVAGFVAWIGWELYRAPVERDDMTRSEQEDAADDAADSMRGQLDHLRKDGVL